MPARRVRQTCQTCRYFEPAAWNERAGWCRHPKADPDHTGIKLYYRSDELGCVRRRPLWWEARESSTRCAT